VFVECPVKPRINQDIAVCLMPEMERHDGIVVAFCGISLLMRDISHANSFLAPSLSLDPLGNQLQFHNADQYSAIGYRGDIR